MGGSGMAGREGIRAGDNMIRSPGLSDMQAMYSTIGRGAQRDAWMTG
jgi:hypothetical protein